MSRIGNKVIAIPAGVTVTFKDATVTVKGPKGTLTQVIDDEKITMAIEANHIKFSRDNEDKELKSKHGLYRTIVSNMIIGVTTGFQKNLLVNGIGFKVAVANNKLTMNIGFSHTVEYEAPEGIKIECPTINEIAVSGIDKVLVGEVAAKLRAFRKPEPYHGYGIQYKDEVIERKEGKAAGKK
ncbi:MAG: 50S ribosomal protein L6 [Clostridia bacterium]